MTIKELQAKLAARGLRVTQAWIKRRFRGIPLGRAITFQQALRWSLRWADTPEGYAFWRKLSEGYQVIAKSGVATPGYPVLKKGTHWSVGCQTLTKTHRINLFRLLAEDLGYEIED